VLGALASGLLLYGISMVYGASARSTSPRQRDPARHDTDRTVLVFGLVFVVIGIAFSSRSAFPHVGLRTSTRARRRR